MSEWRVAMVTGATGGLGRVLVPDLAADGWDLALVGSSAARLEALASELGLDAEHSTTIEANLREQRAAVAAVEAAYERFGRVDALAHLVGGWTGGMHVGRSPDDPYRDMIDQHFWTSLNVVRELAPRMVDAGFGRIAAVSSPMAGSPDAGMSAYGVGKAAQETLFAALAQEVAGSGVTVNVVRVRAIDTAAGEGGSEKTYATTPAEISAAIRYLFSDPARVVNGDRIGLHSGV
jgi:NAD(P)-dependent dehydrogenase (short-subunit alcohol dehydrogenase family)